MVWKTKVVEMLECELFLLLERTSFYQVTILRDTDETTLLNLANFSPSYIQKIKYERLVLKYGMPVVES